MSHLISYRFLAVPFVLLFALSASTVLAQSQLRGKVLDADGAAIAEAQISVIKDGKTVSSALCDDNGEFVLDIRPDNYTLLVSAEGFAEAVPVIELRQFNQPLEIVLQVAAYNATVTITDTVGYQAGAISSATKTLTPLRDLPQSITVISDEVVRDQAMQSIGDVVRYVPGVTAVQGENNRDQVVIRGNSSSADFFLDGLRDDVQYYRDLYNLERLEALKGPNAMIFGRGGGGGVINRVTKQPVFASFRELSFHGGSFGNKRMTADIAQPFSRLVAFRANGVFERSGSFRRHVTLERLGLNPTLAITAGQDTQFRLGYEFFRDHRVADRGIPSYHGRPANTDIATFFGDPDKSRVRARVNVLTGTIQHNIGEVSIHNRTLFGTYNRFYQNFVPGAVSADESVVNLSAYNNATHRRNFFNQTDLTYLKITGKLKHTLMSGIEIGHQVSDNFRQTGFFNNTTTSISLPFSLPTIDANVTFRQNAVDANNRVRANIAATYLQDQIELSKRLQLLAGIRFDHFALGFHNNRNSENLGRTDNLLSPRLGLVFKPQDSLSVYGSYSVSYLPSSGDQFSSLTSVTQTLKPEKFINYEVGAKWDVRPALSLTIATYRLDRTNTRAVDSNDPTRIVQTGKQRTSGFELGINGNITRDWKLIGGFAYQDSYVTSATTSAREGARVAQVPHNTFSLWNNYHFSQKWRAGVGIIHRSDMFAAIDNRVVLPGYTRLDAAIFYSVREHLDLQANIENLFNRRYFVNADGSDNISPGYPRAARLTLSWKF